MAKRAKDAFNEQIDIKVPVGMNEDRFLKWYEKLRVVRIIGWTLGRMGIFLNIVGGLAWSLVKGAIGFYLSFLKKRILG